MTLAKKVGIWMDHSSAHLIEIKDDGSNNEIVSKFTYEEKEQTEKKSEFLMHNKENHERSAYYKKLGEIIKGYTDVVLFGPTEAKTELLNLLKKDHHFDKIKIVVKNSDKLTEHQQHAFVKDYFFKELI